MFGVGPNIGTFLLIEAFAGPTFAGQAAHAVKTDRLCLLGS